MTDCIFCDIVEKKQPTEFLFENSELIVINDIHPAAPVHLLVLPKEHIESVIALNDNHKDLVSRLIYVARDMAKKKELSGYKLVFNVGKNGGQVIPHIHLHLLGGWIDRKSIEEISHRIVDPAT